jgi:branched-chain amino acid transport system substrate-binding protein
MFVRTVIGVFASAMLAIPALAQDAYVIGLTGALTGPPSSTYSPAVEALRLYVDRVNAAGGINGKPIKLVIQDDSAEPSKAAANAKKLVTQDNVVLLINATLSTTYAPVVAEAKRANVPLAASVGRGWGWGRFLRLLCFQVYPHP